MDRLHLGARLKDALAAAPDRPFLPLDGRMVTRQETLALAAARQAQLRAAAITASDIVFVGSGRGSPFWIDLLALWGLGAVAAPFDPAMAPEQAAILLDTARPKAIIGDAPAWTAAAPPRLPESLSAPGGTFTAADQPDDARATLLFTSGSTGRPKAVDLSHRALAGNCLATLDAIGLGTDDRLFIAIPFHFTSAINHFLAAALGGAAFLCTEARLIHADLHRAVVQSGATCFGGAPLQLRWIGECARDSGALPLKWLMSSGDHLPADVIATLAAALPAAKVFTVYGLTEVGGRFCILPPAMLPAKAGAVGRPIAGLEVAVMDEDGRPAEAGEVWVRGNWLCDGYYRNPGATAESLTDGWFRTGDLGRFDPDGLLVLEGRKDDIFKSSGQKVSVVPIAAELMRLDLFADVAVAPAPHPVVGLVPHVFYVLRPGAVFKRGEVLRHLRATLPANHLPQGFTEVAAIPRTGSGKIRREAIRALLAVAG